MRVFFAMTGQLWYGGVVQQSILLIRHLRRLGCEVLPFAAVAPPHNDEISPELLDYELGFNVGDYALRQKPLPLRWLAGWFARRRVAHGDPFAARNGHAVTGLDVGQVARELIYRPSAADIERANRLRRAFAPDVDYACELSMARYFGLLDDLDVPLVVAAQGFEVMKRRGVDITPEIHRNAPRIDLVISGSAANVRENIAADVPFLAAKTRVVPYGISTDYLAELSVAEAQERTQRFVAPTSDHDFVVSVLSRVDIEKGTDLALHAIRILRSAGVPARLRLIGDSLDGAAFRSVIEAKIRLLDLTGYVDLIGLVRNKRDKIALLHTSDAFAGCFIRSEPFGLVVLEAMATGLPVVVPDTGAAPEILHRTARPAGRLYRTNDTGQLADQLRWLHEHPAEARRMGQAGREAVAGYFHAERMAHDVHAVFAEAIASRRRADSPSLPRKGPGGRSKPPLHKTPPV